MKNKNFIWTFILMIICYFFTAVIILKDKGEVPELYFCLGFLGQSINTLIIYLIFHRKKSYYRHFTNLKLNKSNFIMKQEPWFLDDNLAPDINENQTQENKLNE